MNSYLQCIGTLESFKEVFRSMGDRDPKMAENIKESINSALEENHTIILKQKVSKEKIIEVLLKEQINVQALASQYLNLCDQLSYREKNLWEFAFQASELFFENLFDMLDLYFDKKKSLMFNEIRKTTSWYTGIMDTAKKGGSLINSAAKNLNELSKKYIGAEFTSDTNIIEDRTLVEELLNKHLNEKTVSEDVAKMLERACKKYEKDWANQIAKQVPDVQRLSVFTLTNEFGNTVDVPFQLGTTEQAMLVGMGSTIVGTLGLAAGWHTISYALMHVFPPLAIFTIFLTLFSGYVTKDKEVEQREKQINEVVNQYHRYFLTQLDITPLKELGDISIRKFIKQTSEEIVNKTIGEWEKSILGGLRIEDYRMLNTAFSRHLILVTQALEELNCN